MKLSGSHSAGHQRLMFLQYNTFQNALQFIVFWKRTYKSLLKLACLCFSFSQIISLFFFAYMIDRAHYNNVVCYNSKCLLYINILRNKQKNASFIKSLIEYAD